MPSRTLTSAAVGRSILAERRSSDPRELQRRFEALVRRQWGVIERPQLRDLGWSDAKIDRWVAAGRLIRLLPGVYAVGHSALRSEGWWVAALLATGPSAALSHFTAAELWGLDAPRRHEVHVTTPRRSGRTASGFTLHRVRRLADEARAVRRGFPCTTVERTILDLADLLALRDVERLIESAEVAGVLDVGRLTAIAAAAVGRRGRGRLARALDAYRPRPDGTRSELEARFLALCARHRLPKPLINAWIDGVMVDFAWPAATLIVETDGWDYHRTRRAFARDRGRDASLAVAGWQVLRFTWADVELEPQRVAAKIRAVIRHRVA